MPARPLTHQTSAHRTIHRRFALFPTGITQERCRLLRGRHTWNSTLFRPCGEGQEEHAAQVQGENAAVHIGKLQRHAAHYAAQAVAERQQILERLCR